MAAPRSRSINGKIGEYVTATARFNLGAGEALAEQQPCAWILEAGYGLGLFASEPG